MKSRQALADELIEALKSVPSEIIDFFSAISKLEERLGRRANPQNPDDVGYEDIQILNELGIESESQFSWRINFYTRSIRVENPAVKLKLLDTIKSWINEFMDNDRLVVGDRVVSHTVEDILKGLVRMAITKSPEEASAQFCDCVEEQAIIFHRYFLLEGIEIEERMELFDGVSLIPLPGRSSVLPGSFFERDGASKRVLGSKALLKVGYRMSPAISKPDIPESQDSQIDCVESEFESWEFAWALTMAGPAPVQIVMAWNHLAYDHPLNLSPLRWSSHRGVYRVIGYIWAKKFTKEQINEAKNICEKLMGLDSHVIDYLNIPVKRWIASKAGFDTVDRFIDFGIALESFYLHDIEQRSELSFRLRLRAALHLGENSDHRKELVEKFKKVYSLRSRAVHKGKLGDDMKKRELAANTLVEVQNLFKDSLSIIIESNEIPEWEEIELGVRIFTEGQRGDSTKPSR